MNDIPSPKPECERCVHVNVCLLYRAVGSLLTNNFEEKSDNLAAPFKVGDLAKICTKYELKAEDV